MTDKTATAVLAQHRVHVSQKKYQILCWELFWEICRSHSRKRKSGLSLTAIFQVLTFAGSVFGLTLKKLSVIEASFLVEKEATKQHEVIFQCL